MNFIRLFLTLIFLMLLVGCHWNRSFKPITPGQILSGERSRLGIAAMEQGNLGEAEKRLEEAVKLNKKDINHRRHYAEALWQRGKYEESLQQLGEAVKLGGNNDVSLHISLAEKYLAMTQPSTAYRHADLAVRLAPQEYKGWTLRGKAGWLLAVGQRNSDSPEKVEQYMIQAKNDYYRALSLSPNTREILPELAAVQMSCGQPELALATWQNLQESFPKGAEPTDLLCGKAETFIALYRFDEAIDCLVIVRQREPERLGIEQRLREIAAMTQRKMF
jgi:tetratricopeptide (TPR) repeat protein